MKIISPQKTNSTHLLHPVSEWNPDSIFPQHKLNLNVEKDSQHPGRWQKTMFYTYSYSQRSWSWKAMSVSFKWHSFLQRESWFNYLCKKVIKQRFSGENRRKQKPTKYSSKQLKICSPTIVWNIHTSLPEIVSAVKDKNLRWHTQAHTLTIILHCDRMITPVTLDRPFLNVSAPWQMRHFFSNNIRGNNGTWVNGIVTNVCSKHSHC